MRSLTGIALLAALMVGGPMLAGCDKTRHESESTEVKKDGTEVKKDTKTTQAPDGSVTKTEKTTVDNPNTP